MFCWLFLTIYFFLHKIGSNNGSGGDDSHSLTNLRERVDTTTLPDDEDYIVPPGQCCIKVEFGRSIHRWCPVTNCFISKKQCFDQCHDNHRLVAPLECTYICLMLLPFLRTIQKLEVLNLFLSTFFHCYLIIQRNSLKYISISKCYILFIIF